MKTETKKLDTKTKPTETEASVGLICDSETEKRPVLKCKMSKREREEFDLFLYNNNPFKDDLDVPVSVAVNSIKLFDEPYYGEIPGVTRRGGKFRFGVVKCCPEWRKEITEKIRSSFEKEGIKSKKRISRAIDIVMYILRAQTTDRCDETSWCLNSKNGQAVALSWTWFTKFFHSKVFAVRSLSILKKVGILTVDHSWIHVPRNRSGELEADSDWIPWTNGKTPVNTPQGWLVNYEPKTDPDKWIDFPVSYDSNEWLSDVALKIDSVGEINAGNDAMPVVLNKEAIINGLRDGTLEMHQTLRDIGLCRKYQTKESWQNTALKYNADGTLKTKQRRTTDKREYHAVAMVSKKFMAVAFTGTKGSKWENCHMEELCDLHTGVIPSVLLADAIIERKKAGKSSRPSKKDLTPAFDALKKLQSQRVKKLADGTLTVTRDGDVYMEAVREMERKIETDPFARWYLSSFFKDCKNDDDKRDLVKPYFLKTVYINDKTRRRRHRTVNSHKMLSEWNPKFESSQEAYVCVIFEDVLRREFPKFTKIVTKKYVSKEQKTELYDIMSQGEKILTSHVSRWLRHNLGIDTIRKHDALVTFVSPESKLSKVTHEQIIWNSVKNWK